jgi:single-strand DNA-binding protein
MELASLGAIPLAVRLLAPRRQSTSTEVIPMATRTTTTDTAKPVTEEQSSERRSSGPALNRVALVGRLVADAELRHTASGIPVTTVRIATTGRTETQFVNVVLWRQLAEFASTYLGKGRLVYVDGRIRSRSWTATDGSKRQSTEVVADTLQALSSRRPAQAA